MPVSRRQFVATTAAAAAGPFVPLAGAVGPAPPATFTLPPLPYGYDALEVIDEKTMRIHHDLHHGGYVRKLNAALAEETFHPHSFEDLVGKLNRYSEARRTAIRNNGGGHCNHTMYWQNMSPPGQGGAPSGELELALNRSFGSVDQAVAMFVDAAAGRFGSGWGWIIVQRDGSLAITSTPNQDNPLMGAEYVETPGTPLLGVDVWEHAYYLKYQNERKRYLTEFCSIINWKTVSRRYRAVLEG